VSVGVREVTCVGRLPGQVSMTMTTSMQRSMIVIPAQGLIEIRDTLTDLLKEFGTDNKGELLSWKLFICSVFVCSILGPLLFIIFINDLADS